MHMHISTRFTIVVHTLLDVHCAAVQERVSEQDGRE